jgi:DNA-directed RNA polymerase specialized sigma subunit
MLWEDFPEGMPSIDLVTLEEESVREHNVEIDEDWVKGVTSGNGFSELSELQRLIVKMCYYDNIPDIHVAHSLQITINDLKRQKEYIKSILAKELNLKPGKDIRHERSC